MAASLMLGYNFLVDFRAMAYPRVWYTPLKRGRRR